MKVWVAGAVHEAEAEPIILLLTDQDKVNIAAMPADAHRYMAYPARQLTHDQALALIRSVEPAVLAPEPPA
jgi:hypothetical protein